jgi:hypothetical protein
MRKHIASLAVLLLTLPISGSIALAQEQPAGSVVVSTGIAQITDNNIVTAQSSAIADAHRKALIQAAGTIMTFEQLEQQFPALKQAMFNKAADYIESYKILYDSRRGDRYHITLQSTVDLRKLENHLMVDASIAPEHTLPSLLLMIARQPPGRDVYTCWWSFIDPETALSTLDLALSDELQKQGFEVVDHSRMITQISGSNVYGCLDVDGEDLQALGRQFQADVVINAKAQAGPAAVRSEGSPAQEIQANIVGRAVKTDEGSTLASIESYMPSSGESDAPAYDSALRNAARAFARQIGEQLSQRWSKETKGVVITTLSVTGISSYLDFTRFKNALKKNIPAITTITQKSAAAKGALLELESVSDTVTLAQAMEGKEFENFSISVTRIAPPLIEADVRISAEKVEPEELEPQEDDL